MDLGTRALPVWVEAMREYRWALRALTEASLTSADRSAPLHTGKSKTTSLTFSEGRSSSPTQQTVNMFDISGWNYNPV